MAFCTLLSGRVLCALCVAACGHARACGWTPLERKCVFHMHVGVCVNMGIVHTFVYGVCKNLHVIMWYLCGKEQRQVEACGHGVLD
jgi:hypothetical protein